jgi:hypothetical protein
MLWNRGEMFKKLAAAVVVVFTIMGFTSVWANNQTVTVTVVEYSVETYTVTVTTTKPAPLTYTYVTQFTVVVPRYTTAVFNFTYPIQVTSIRQEWVMPFPWSTAFTLFVAVIMMAAGAYLWSYRPRGV